MAGAVAKPLGTLHPNIAPYGETFRCADGGRIILAVGSDAQFKALCTTLGLEEIPDETEFASNTARVRHRGALAQRLSTAMEARERGELLNALIVAGVPAGAVLRIDEVMATPAARAMVLEEMVDGERTLRLKGNVFRIERS
jgi:crotonobetainyl-CoA:carnitine CoA-transferase CaiB-like acyl-CoA transferase